MKLLDPVFLGLEPWQVILIAAIIVAAIVIIICIAVWAAKKKKKAQKAPAEKKSASVSPQKSEGAYADAYEEKRLQGDKKAEEKPVTKTEEKPVEEKPAKKAEEKSEEAKPVKKAESKPAETKTAQKAESKPVKKTESKPAAQKTEDKSVAKETGKVYHISKRKEDGRWQIKAEGGAKAIKLFATQAEAMEYGKQLAINQDARIMIHKTDGSFRKLTY